MNYDRPELQQKLAGEYVLGTLQGGARRRFEQLLVEDRGLQQYVQVWERRLAPWLLVAAPEPVPDRVWAGIQRRLGHGAPEVSASDTRGGFWRWLGVASTAVAALLAVVLVTRPVPAPAPLTTDVAVLASGKSEPVWIVRQRGDLLELSGLASVEVPAGRDLELWSIPQGGSPLSLGVVRRTGARHAEVHLTAQARERLSRGALLAISLEPAGGSPTGSPTGPVLFTGKRQV